MGWGMDGIGEEAKRICFSRRSFLRLGMGAWLMSTWSEAQEGCTLAEGVSLAAATRGPQHHFFGYYDKSPWDASGRYLLALEVEFAHRPPTAEDGAVVGLVDIAQGYAFRPLAETHAWNWQQGCMLQWMPNAPERLIIYNDRQGDRFVAVIMDISTGQRRTVPHPIYTLSHDGRFALTLSFARLQHARPGYGYPGIPDPYEADPAPERDGIFWVDLESGESRLVISIAQIAAFRPLPSMEGATEHRFEHLFLNQDDSRFIFLHRWNPPGRKGWLTRLFTANPDGSEIFCLSDHEMVSHFDWKNPRQVLAWARRHGIGDRYFLFTDRTEEVEVVGEGVLTSDGHCSYSPDGRWLLTDTYPDAQRRRTLILYRLADGRRFDVGRFFSPPELTGEIRCDLHPRWSRDGQQISIDSAHEGHRQMYVLDVRNIVAL